MGVGGNQFFFSEKHFKLADLFSSCSQNWPEEAYLAYKSTPFFIFYHFFKGKQLVTSCLPSRTM